MYARVSDCGLRISDTSMFCMLGWGESHGVNMKASKLKGFFFLNGLGCDNFHVCKALFLLKRGCENKKLQQFIAPFFSKVKVSAPKKKAETKKKKKKKENQRTIGFPS